jgi:small GTP-binding protein
MGIPMKKLKIKEWTLKILLLGDMAVGKTSLINQYIERSFESDYRPTLGVNIISKDIEIKEANSLIRLIIWDIAGQDKYEKTRRAYYEGCAGALLVYDLTRYDSFLNIESKWFNDIKKHVIKKTHFILIGNKVDLKDNRKVSFEEGLELANKINAINFLETSALSGENVEKAFLRLIYQILSNYGAEFIIN